MYDERTYSPLSTEERQDLGNALATLMTLMERYPRYSPLLEVASHFDLPDDLWLLTQVMGLDEAGRSALVQLFLLTNGTVQAKPLSQDAVMLVSHDLGAIYERTRDHERAVASPHDA
ncbi:hypothetical protein [Bosea psychrotolerans]|uniref:Uncharacterized protein n=1 Tax=Bosea psychrotolerans TaxID=1871628 RepID=A0A2S4LUW3_9HYPH|nr:hypothetical protein [Bosea psychrotolerans]POR46139.1 hypothetical protein CYD53_12754 [Bosea psychrotolerans]